MFDHNDLSERKTHKSKCTSIHTRIEIYDNDDSTDRKNCE